MAYQKQQSKKLFADDDELWKSDSEFYLGTPRDRIILFGGPIRISLIDNSQGKLKIKIWAEFLWWSMTIGL